MCNDTQVRRRIEQESTRLDIISIDTAMVWSSGMELHFTSTGKAALCTTEGLTRQKSLKNSTLLTPGTFPSQWRQGPIASHQERFCTKN